MGGRHAQNPNPAAAIIPNRDVPVAVVTPTAPTAGNATPNIIPADIDGAVPTARAKPGGMSAVDKQLQRLQIRANRAAISGLWVARVL